MKDRIPVIFRKLLQQKAGHPYFCQFKRNSFQTFYLIVSIPDMMSAASVKTDIVKE